MKNILVTGATSFIGQYLIAELLNDSNNIIYALVRPNSKHKNNLIKFKNVNIIEIDMKNIAILPQKINKIDICFHLAWDGTRTLERYDEKLQQSNYMNSIALYDALVKLECKVFIGIGSQAEYGFNDGIITEETETKPNTAYGKYKLFVCNKIMESSLKDNIRFIWGRVFSIYGKGDNDNTLLMTSIKRMKNNEVIDMTLGTQYWNYLYVEDLAKILVILAKNIKAHGIYNLASDDTRKLKFYIEEIKNILKSKSIVNFGAVPYRQEGVVNIRPDISKLMMYVNGFKFSKFADAILKI